MGETRGQRPSLILGAALTIVMAACGAVDPGAGAPPPIPTAEPSAFATETPAPVTTAVAAPAPTAEPQPYSRIRVFVAAEGPLSGGTGELYVLESAGRGDFSVIAKLPMGGWPHNIAVSPNGKWVAVADRSSDQVGIVDPVELREIARVKVGRQPHAILWQPDSSVLYVGSEKENFITRLEAGTWRTLQPLPVGVKQHTFAMDPARPNELWFTVTMDNVADHLRVYDLTTGKIAQVRTTDVHDAYFTPDMSEVWSSSSGFLDKPSDRMVIYDPVEKTVKGEIHFPGRYPFHTLKRLQDGLYYPKDTSIMLLSSHYSAEKGRNGASLLWVDWKARKIVDETPVGVQPFHTTYDPVGERVLLTSNVDGMVNVIDWNTHRILQKIPVPKPHGIVSVGL